MQRVTFVPGNVVSPAAITIPTTVPDIDLVVAAVITRLPSGQTIPDHAAADVIAAIDDHAVHGHDITTVAAAGGGAAVTEPAVAGPLETAGAGQTNPAAVDALAAAQAHAATATDVAHGASVGASPVVAAVPTKITTRTLSLDVDTELGDLLTLDYIEVGERVLVS